MLAHKKIVIVGGGSGIGLAVAQKAIAAGAEVILASRSIDKLMAAVQSLGPLARLECVDVTDEVSVQEFAERIGPIDHLVMSIKPHLPAGPFLKMSWVPCKRHLMPNFGDNIGLPKSWFRLFCPVVQWCLLQVSPHIERMPDFRRSVP